MPEFSQFTPHFAGIDPTLIIWIIVGIFWFIAQLVNKVKESQVLPPEDPSGSSQRPSRPARPVTRRAVEDELKEFLESLTGVEPEQPREPPSPAPQDKGNPLHPAYQAVQDRDDREEQVPVPKQPPPAVSEPLPPTADPEDVYAYAPISDTAYDQLGKIDDIKEIEELAWGAGTGTTYRLIRSSQNLSVNLSSIRIPTMRIPLTALSSQPESVAHAPRLHDIKAIRKSIVAHTLLAPPKALRDDLDEMHKP